jgi:hypothetical protein
MNQLHCQACHYKCSNEAQFTSHLKSKRHIRLTATSEENISIDIEEIEQPIPITLQPPSVNNSLMETLLQQNQMMLQMLMNKKSTDDSDSDKRPRFSVEAYLKKRDKAINFEDLFTRKYILSSEHNEKYVKDLGDAQVSKIIDHQSLPKTYKYAIDFFFTPFDKIHQNKRPIFCSNARHGTFYVKTENKWVKMDKFELSNKIFGPLWAAMFRLQNNVARMNHDVFEEIYHRSYYNWQRGNRNEILVNICSIEKEDFVHKFIPTLIKLTDKKYVSYGGETPEKYDSAQDETDAGSGSETETDEY